MKTNKKVILFTEHYYLSSNKAGFHWIAKAFAEKLYDVIIITTPISLLNIKKKAYLKNNLKSLNKIKKVDSHIKEYILFSLLHPIEIKIKWKIINEIVKYIMAMIRLIYKNTLFDQKIKYEIENADIIVFESSLALLFIERIKKFNKYAKYIYRVSDDLRFLKIDDYVRRKEKMMSFQFDIVSVPSLYIYQKFMDYKVKNVYLQKHCINKKMFDLNVENPYTNNNINAIFVGMSHLDFNFIDIASSYYEDIKFHIIGPFKKQIKRNNIIYYGVMKFENTIPYIKYADIGLATRSDANHVEMLSDSLKILQYEYCHVPIIIPDKINKNGNYIFKYKYNNESSIIKAIKLAIETKKNTCISFPKIFDWTDLINIWIKGNNDNE